MSDNPMATPMATHGAPSWIEHRGQDGPAARAFYEKVLGWTIAELPMKDGSTYHGIMLGETPVGGFPARPRNKAAGSATSRSTTSTPASRRPWRPARRPCRNPSRCRESAASPASAIPPAPAWR